MGHGSVFLCLKVEGVGHVQLLMGRNRQCVCGRGAGGGGGQCRTELLADRTELQRAEDWHPELQSEARKSCFLALLPMARKPAVTFDLRGGLPGLCMGQSSGRPRFHSFLSAFSLPPSPFLSALLFISETIRPQNIS